MRELATSFRWISFLMLKGFLVLVGSQANAQVDPIWDHYRAYAIPEATRLAGPPVTLKDQFGSWSYSTTELQCFSNPDQKTHDGITYGINAPRLHYTWWRLPSDGFDRPGVQVSNQFGPQSLHVKGNAQFLLNPATKNDAGPIPAANHYKCYFCEGTAPNVTVALADQFTQRSALVGRPFWLCNPTQKIDVSGLTHEIVDPDQHLVCYSIEPELVSFTAVVSDQFIQNRQLALLGSLYLCVPSEKHDPTPTETSTWGRVKTLYR